jgi:peptidoglycan/LPS O-acetylase OafA/YrhL
LKSASQESPDDLLARDPGLRDAFAADEQVQRVRMGKVGALLIAVLMPAGVSLDFLVYGSDGKVGEFLILRLISSALALGLWAVLRVPRGERYARIIGPTLALIPSAFIAVMIAKTDGWDSPYYAGLNPVLLAVTLVVSLLHAVFEFLAFRNDVAFWRSAKSMEGLSLQSLSVNLFFSVVIFLYLVSIPCQLRKSQNDGIRTVVHLAETSF